MGEVATMANERQTTGINLEVPRELHRRIKAHAALRGMTMHEYVIVTLAEHVSEIDTKKRRAS